MEIRNNLVNNRSNCNVITNEDKNETKHIVYRYFHRRFQINEITWISEKERNDNLINNGSIVNNANNGHHLENNRNKEIKLNKICERLLLFSNELLRSFGENIDEMCEKLSNTLSQYDNSITEFSMFGNDSYKAIANELFSEGIKWGHIVTLFAFTSQFAIYYHRKNLSNLIDEIADWLISYINVYLLQWIINHGTWEGLIAYGDGHDEIDTGLIRNNRAAYNKYVTYGKRLAIFATLTSLSVAAVLMVIKKVQHSVQ